MKKKGKIGGSVCRKWASSSQHIWSQTNKENSRGPKMFGNKKREATNTNLFVESDSVRRKKAKADRGKR